MTIDQFHLRQACCVIFIVLAAFLCFQMNKVEFRDDLFIETLLVQGYCDKIYMLESSTCLCAEITGD